MESKDFVGKGTMKVEIVIGTRATGHVYLAERELEADQVSQGRKLIEELLEDAMKDGALRPDGWYDEVTLGVTIPDPTLAAEWKKNEVAAGSGLLSRVTSKKFDPAPVKSRGRLVWDGEPGKSSAAWVDDETGPITLTRYPDFESFKNRASQNPSIATAGTPVFAAPFIHTKDGLKPLEMKDLGSETEIPEGKHILEKTWTHSLQWFIDRIGKCVKRKARPGEKSDDGYTILPITDKQYAEVMFKMQSTSMARYEEVL